jgi:hypothetical protein
VEVLKMRSVFALAAALAIVVAPILAPAQTVSSGLAPADEYFGASSESVLEIRNRLTVVESKSDADARATDGVSAIDYFEEAVVDWQRKYPGDHWVINALARMVHCYARAGAATSERATAVLALLTKHYPKSPEADQALFALWSAPARAGTSGVAVQQGIVSGSVVDASTGKPVPGAIVMVAPNRESSDIASTPFATTGADGSFSIANVPFAQAEYIVVEPPRGSAYAAYHGTVSTAGGKAQAGVIRLAIH